MTKLDTVVDVKTTPSVLNKENGLSWLGFIGAKNNEDDMLKGKSAFKLISAYGTAIFDFMPFPTNQNQKGGGTQIQLTLNSKKVHNPDEARVQVELWVGSGKIELGSCSLCFDEMLKSKLLPACGRKGCKERADTGCLREWVGLFSLRVPFFVL
jgi:hypothetical protein